MTLAAARTIHDEYLALLAQGIDPQKQAQDEIEREQHLADSLFINVATKWFAIKKMSGISAVHADDIWRSLEKNVFPAIGHTAACESGSGIVSLRLETIGFGTACSDSGAWQAQFYSGN